MGPKTALRNGTMIPFYQGSLKMLRNDENVRFFVIVFVNNEFMQELINVHFHGITTIYMDITFQIRPQQLADIDQILTIQIVFNNVVS